MTHPQSFAHEFLRRLQFSDQDTLGPELLVTRSQARSFQLGTGASIFTKCLIPAIASARSELILVTCFWAPSPTLTALHDALAKLAHHRQALMRDAVARGEPAIRPLRVCICLSSRSLLQKLLHPQSRSGYVYPPASWPKKLGLPEPALLEAGAIQLRVKSLFFLPFSIMHPKFVVIDRERAFIPSCNVSWEPWLEGCVEITGDAVRSLLAFYSLTWEDGRDSRGFLEQSEAGQGQSSFDVDQAGLVSIPSSAHYRQLLAASGGPLPTLVLPSSHHRNPRFRPLPWQKHAAPPATPLNVALLQLFEQAQRFIYIQTPDFTCQPVVAALLDALARGVDVTLVTNRNIKVLEQLITAGTTTSWCVRSLVRRFHRIQRRGHRTGTEEARRHDVEAGRRRLGRLRVSYFRPHPQACLGGHGRAPLTAQPQPQGEEPVQSHLKLTLVDGEYTVLGSGNMDRASWFTSQELGILFHDRQFYDVVKAGVDAALVGRLHLVFDSEEV